MCRVGDHYFLACSSFEYFPGVPILRSRDLVHWEQIGNALDRPSQLSLPPATPSSGGVYAPTLRHHDGRFWLITTNVAPGGGNLLLTAADPAGPWSEPVEVSGIAGIDPDLAWDDEGRCWCTFNGIYQVRIDPYTGESFGEPKRLWSGAPGWHVLGRETFLAPVIGSTVGLRSVTSGPAWRRHRGHRTRSPHRRCATTSTASGCTRAGSRCAPAPTTWSKPVPGRYVSWHGRARCGRRSPPAPRRSGRSAEDRRGRVAI